MTFKTEWNRIKKSGHYGSFSFKGKADDWNSTVSSHFKTSKLKKPYYGVYIVSQKSTGKIIYVGKAGTMHQDGSFKSQDLRQRLVNQEKKQRRKFVFSKRVVDYGELLIEYVVLRPKSVIPRYVEALLLQAYFDEHKKLPADNTSL